MSDSFTKIVSPDNLDEIFKTEHKNVLDIFEDKFCLFLGAGISKLVGYKLWGELACSMVKKYQEENLLEFSKCECLNLISKERPIDVMDYLYSLPSGPAKFYSILDTCMTRSEDNSLEVFESLRFLIERSNCIVIQTNIDTALEKCFEKDLLRDPSLIARYPDFIGGSSKKLTYLHGKLGSSEYVFTRKDYNECYLNENSNVMRYLTEIFRDYNVIFLGYSLRDFEVTQALYKAKSNKQFVAFEPHYKLKDIEIGINREIYEQNYKIKLIPYSIEEKGYGFIVDVINQLKKDLKPISSVEYLSSFDDLDQIIVQAGTNNE